MIRIIIATFMLVTLSQSKEYKAVFDCSSSNASYIKSRMWLIGKTMDMIEKKGNKATFVITLHGGCVPMVSKEYDMIVSDEDVKTIQEAQEYLKSLSQKRGVKVVACAMSLSSNAMEQKEVLPFVSIVPNSFIDTIGYQNDGYALMTFK